MLNVMRVPGRLVPLVSIVVLPLVVTMLAAASASAGQRGSGDLAAMPSNFSGPPPPAPPSVITRDNDGNATVRATRIPEGPALDGRLDDPVYQQVPSFGDFIQSDPDEGVPATEQTDVWVMFDDTRIYVSARLWDSQPQRMVANEMRRDQFNLINNENFAVALDTFYDRRNGYLFHTTPVGGMFDGTITDESQNNRDWNTVWWSRSARFDRGWTVEMAIPFKSLRYKAGASQIWGINFRRVVRWKNEFSYLTLIPRSYGPRGIIRLSQAATLVGIEPPTASRTFEIKPYAVAGTSTNLNADPPFRNDGSADAGFDVKYGLTRGLTADFTYNTDFAQVEDDEQQVNLTRFSVFFPEKREFFLEGQGIFSFGGAGGGGGGGGGGFFGGGGFGGDETPVLFFSRRIGLAENEGGRSVEVPIRAGGRVTGKQGAWSLGFLNIYTGEDASGFVSPTAFTVGRVKRDIFGRSYVGALFTRRSPSGGASSDAYGFDAGLQWGVSQFNSYFARTRNEGVAGDDTSYQLKYEHNGDLYGFQAERLVVGEAFQPETGFLRRADFRKNRIETRWSPRPTSSKIIRKFEIQPMFEYFDNHTGFVETRDAQLRFQTEFHSGDQFTVNFSRTFEGIEEEFDIEDVPIAPGGYDWMDTRLDYRFGPQRKVSGFLSFSTGGFYGGARQQLRYNGRVELSSQLSFEPGITLSWIDLPAGDVVSKLINSRISYTLSPRAFIGALVQYGTAASSLSTNLRFSWEFEPGSNLFVVYSEGRDTDRRGFPTLENRAFVVKIAKLFRF
jgi:hypothetical protein